ncbi:MAG: 30S ribosomal protein S12 methylthiotransferase RimO [Aggregatilineales bacterium]|nr:30S ribosomal protein S12 methylthiotransferase RimO [Chloroflexota bacterium]HOA24525.1 30S ribosomal protein S12 methylthiotransferase RimO [Aggregatilineales bacterium]HQE18013.1 30S ribosomal protein S12 methylthiotransferase RimO [Aggregatilineales bacterium]
MVDPHVYYLVNLGCAKNLVDAESMAQLLTREGYRGTGSPDEASVLIVNTCGFIDAAKQESLNTLRELAENKQPGQLLIAAGCLSQRYGKVLTQEVPGLDGVIGTRRWMDILDLIKRLRGRTHPEPLYHLPGDAETVGTDEHGVLRAAIQGASAYIKIADGCRRPCAFCAIPAIKGTHVSRPPEMIVAEAARLNALGTKEIILISQDTTDYGHDLGMKDGLATLLEQIVEVTPDVPWLRIMYAYPGYVTDRLIEVMAREERIVPYLDIPLQHGSRETLKRMRRPANLEWVYGTIRKLRDAMPDIAIRTTFIVGYPGETDEEFEELVQFVRDMRFDRVGTFTYSYEIGTPSAELPNQVPDDVKQARRDLLMQVQQDISLQRNQEFIGRTLPILVEGANDGLSVGRSYRDAPEIDGMVIVEGELPVGEMVPVRITGAMVYDLVGTVDTGAPIVISDAPVQRGRQAR